MRIGFGTIIIITSFRIFSFGGNVFVSMVFLSLSNDFERIDCDIHTKLIQTYNMEKVRHSASWLVILVNFHYQKISRIKHINLSYFLLSADLNENERKKRKLICTESIINETKTEIFIGVNGAQQCNSG